MVTLEKVAKSFGSFRAVDGVSFSVKRGEVLGCLGPNGAGKSTTMRMINGFIFPDEGRIAVGGCDPAADPLNVRRQTGYVPENVQFYGEMTVRAFLRFVGDARGMRGAKAREALDRTAELCAIAPVLEQPVETLSKGYKSRVALAQALLHDPPVLILDEPTEGLDPNQKQQVREMIRRMGKEKCIIVSTHILEEVPAICTRLVILARGRVAADGSPQEIQRQGGGSLEEAFRRLTLPSAKAGKGARA